MIKLQHHKYGMLEDIYPPYTLTEYFSTRTCATIYYFNYVNKDALATQFVLDKDINNILYIGNKKVTYKVIDKNPAIIRSLIAHEETLQALEKLP